MTLPPLDDLTEPWWAATRRGQLTIQCCRRCHRLQHPPRPICLQCLGDQFDWAPMSGRGTIDAWTTVHRSPGPGFDPPYVVARIRLEEGPILLSALSPLNPISAYRCGEAVNVGWRPLTDGRQLPIFTR